jgi:hypothetical protein
MVHLFQAFVKSVESVNTTKKISENSRTAIKTRIKANVNNTGVIYIGGQDVLTNGYPLVAGESEDDIFLPILDEIFYYGTVSGDKLHVLIYEDPHIHEIRKQQFAKYGQEY